MTSLSAWISVLSSERAAFIGESPRGHASQAPIQSTQIEKFRGDFHHVPVRASPVTSVFPTTWKGLAAEPRARNQASRTAEAHPSEGASEFPVRFHYVDPSPCGDRFLCGSLRHSALQRSRNA